MKFSADGAKPPLRHEYLLSCDGASFAYGSKQVLRNCTLQVRPGEFVCLIGPNGSGKTTLLRLLTGLLKPESGAIQLEGSMLSAIPPRTVARRIAMVPQNEHAVFPFPVRTVVLFGRYPHRTGFGFETAEDYAAAERSLALLDLFELADCPVTELSGGELHRVLIARAIAQETEILLLDEPNAHLDIRHQIALFDLLRTLNRRDGKTIICATHDLSHAGIYADRIAVIDNGIITEDGPPEKVLTERTLQEHFGINARVLRDPDDGSIAVRPLPAGQAIRQNRD